MQRCQHSSYYPSAALSRKLYLYYKDEKSMKIEIQQTSNT